ncbi:DNA binding protein [[Candida] boidinii]|nr:DNA binding protein [[Candida] boidinii]GMF97652.1 unnamed protein product [[Candida] boidinii]
MPETERIMVLSTPAEKSSELDAQLDVSSNNKEVSDNVSNIGDKVNENETNNNDAKNYDNGVDDKSGRLDEQAIKEAELKEPAEAVDKETAEKQDVENEGALIANNEVEKEVDYEPAKPTSRSRPDIAELLLNLRDYIPASKLFTDIDSNPLIFYLAPPFDKNKEMITLITINGGEIANSVESPSESRVAEGPNAPIPIASPASIPQDMKQVRFYSYKFILESIGKGMQLDLTNYLIAGTGIPEDVIDAAAVAEAALNADSSKPDNNVDSGETGDANGDTGALMHIPDVRDVAIIPENGKQGKAPVRFFNAQEDHMLLEEIRKRPWMGFRGHQIYKDISETDYFKLTRRTPASLRERIRTLRYDIQYVYKADSRNKLLKDKDGNYIKVYTIKNKTTPFTATEDFLACKAMFTKLKPTLDEKGFDKLNFPTGYFDQYSKENPNHTPESWRQRYKNFIILFGIANYIKYYISTVKQNCEPLPVNLANKGWIVQRAAWKKNNTDEPLVYEEYNISDSDLLSELKTFEPPQTYPESEAINNARKTLKNEARIALKLLNNNQTHSATTDENEESEEMEEIENSEEDEEVGQAKEGKKKNINQREQNVEGLIKPAELVDDASSSSLSPATSTEVNPQNDDNNFVINSEDVSDEELAAAAAAAAAAASAAVYEAARASKRALKASETPLSAVKEVSSKNRDEVTSPSKKTTTSFSQRKTKQRSTPDTNLPPKKKHKVDSNKDQHDLIEEFKDEPTTFFLEPTFAKSFQKFGPPVVLTEIKKHRDEFIHKIYNTIDPSNTTTPKEVADKLGTIGIKEYYTVFLMHRCNSNRKLVAKCIQNYLNTDGKELLAMKRGVWSNKAIEYLRSGNSKLLSSLKKYHGAESFKIQSESLKRSKK